MRFIHPFRDINKTVSLPECYLEAAAMKRFDNRPSEELPVLLWSSRTTPSGEEPRKRRARRRGDLSVRLYRYLRNLDR